MEFSPAEKEISEGEDAYLAAIMIYENIASSEAPKHKESIHSLPVVSNKLRFVKWYIKSEKDLIILYNSFLKTVKLPEYYLKAAESSNLDSGAIIPYSNFVLLMYDNSSFNFK